MSKDTKFKIVLHAPEIPGNTGSIGRTCVALSAQLILIKPYGFDLNEKAVRRAGLDYWKHVDLVEYDSWDHFLEGEKPVREKLIFLENNRVNEKKNFFQANYQKGCYLILGSETKGIPDSIIENYKDRTFELPMFSEHVRSLNLSNTATAVAYECLRHLSYS
jgi:tRNA (cytidine/uridine-2'-O-)-methyltransferase